MAMTNIIPEIWAKTILALLEKSLVAARIANRTIAGEVAVKGDQLHIIGAGAVATGDYGASANITYETVSDAVNTLTVNLDKYFAFKVEDSEKRQANVPWQQIYAERGTYELRDDIDTLLFAEYASAGLDSYETGTTPWQLGAAGADVPTLMAALAKQLNDADAPQEGRFFAMPTICLQAFQLYFASRSTNLGDTVLANGALGRAFGFDLFVSRNVGGSTTLHGLAGVYGHSIAYAQQVNPSSIEELRAEGRFASLVRGRVLAGIKTFRSGTSIDVNLNSTLLA